MSDPGVIAAATAKNAADDGSPGNVDLERPRRTPVDRDRETVDGDRRAERAEHALGVIAARRGRHDDSVSPSACKPASSTRRLHLRARDRQLVAERRAARRPGRRAARASRRRARRSCAPIARSGSTILRHRPRLRSDASPLSTDRNGRPGEHARRAPASWCRCSRSRARRRARANPSTPGSVDHDRAAVGADRRRPSCASTRAVAPHVGAGREVA